MFLFCTLNASSHLMRGRALSDNLVLEHLPALRADNVEIKSSIRDLTAHVRLIADQVVALVKHGNYTMSKFAELEGRVDRIERRLDLVE